MSISAETLEIAVARIALMAFFPASDPNAKAVITIEISSMCANDEQVRWLASRFTRLYSKWPGIAELRAVLCSKFRPLDGIEANSTVYSDEGIPSERDQLTDRPPTQLTAGAKAHLLLAGETLPPVSADADMGELVRQCADAATMPVPRRPRTIAEIEEGLYKHRAIPEPDPTRMRPQSIAPEFVVEVEAARQQELERRKARA